MTRIIFATILWIKVFFGILCGFAQADLSEEDTQKAGELYGALMAALEQAEEAAVEESLEEIVELPRDAVRVFRDELEKILPSLEQNYGEEYELVANSLWEDTNDAEDREEVQELRETMRDIWQQIPQLEEEEAKVLVKETAGPAMERLIDLLEVDPDNIVGENPELTNQRLQLELVYSSLYELDRKLGNRGQSPRERLADLEGDFSVTNPNQAARVRRVYEQVDSFRDQLSDLEYEGIVQLNDWRVVLGLNPLEVDIKLVEACRGHSQDMIDLNFFAHESPVEGKHEPWDRAEKAGTTCSSENIAMGQTSADEVNWGWFYSPGHHVNLFREQDVRMGLGLVGVHWTQVFGRD